jgi:hypothetical protein
VSPVPASGRRRQAPPPLRRRVRLDLLGWGFVAGVGATLALGLTGGGWLAAGVLGLLVVAGFVVLTLLSSTSSRRPARGAGRTPADGPTPSPREGRDDTPDP